MNIRHLFFIAILFLMLTLTASSQDKGLGLGVILGEPTGISLKSWIDTRHAIDGGLAWSYYRGTSIHLHVDYLMHSFDAFNTEEPLVLYYGIGGRLKSGNNVTQFGVRGVIGIDYLLRRDPFDFFLELAPILDVAPSTDLFFNAGLGARYFFN